MFAPVSASVLGLGARPLASACKRVTPQGARHMATLKDIKLRMKSVSSIAKLTKTMQMVASSKLRSATRKVQETKGSVAAVNKILGDKDISAPSGSSSLYVAITSDKGMCGPVNNQLVRYAKGLLRQETDNKSDVALLGTKGTPGMVLEFPRQFVFSLKDFGKRDPSFLETSFVVDGLLAGRSYESVNVIYNHFKNALTYLVTDVPIPGPNTLLANKGKFAQYEFDEDEDATFRDIFEYQIALNIWAGLMEGRASELAARMTSMDNATKNASSIISLLGIQYNRALSKKVGVHLHLRVS